MAESKEGDIPPGFTLRHTLRGHEGVINRIAWSPDGKMLASPSEDKTIRLWDIQTGELLERRSRNEKDEVDRRSQEWLAQEKHPRKAERRCNHHPGSPP